MTSIAEIIHKIENYCAYQERSESEVIAKLSPYHLSQSEVDEIVEGLKNNNFLSEERFVNAFIRGKLYAKQWGKNKIVSQLKAKGIADSLITEQLNSIDKDDYRQIVDAVISKWLKNNTLSKDTYPKLYRFLLSKGFEYEMITAALKNVKYNTPNNSNNDD